MVIEEIGEKCYYLVIKLRMGYIKSNTNYFDGVVFGYYAIGDVGIC